MRRAEVTRDELEALVTEYRHVRVEHARAHRGGRVRRRLDRRLVQVDARFERLLREAVADAEVRRAWLEHLRNGAPAPAEPSAAAPPLVFRGRSETGSLVEVRQRPEGDYDVVVDGAAVERVAAVDDLAQTGPGVAFRLGGVVFQEVFALSPEALTALARFVSEPGSGPPFDRAQELIADGLVDRDLGLTARGRRALRNERRPAGLAAPPVLRVSARGVGEQPRRYLERKLRRVLRLSPLPVIGARAVVAEERNPSLERPATAKATVEVRGQDVHAHAAAGSPVEAVDLLAERLSRRLRGLGRRRDAVRQGTGALEPGEWRHGGVAAPRPVDERELP